MVVALHTDSRCTTLALAQGIPKASISLSFHNIHNAAYGGGPQDSRDLFGKFQLIWDYQGYLVLNIALDSIYLNPDNNIA